MAQQVSEQRDLDDVSRFVVSVPSGDFVFEMGDTGTEMFIIQKGEIEILKPVGPETHALARLEPGDFFGEMSLLESTPREVSARAVRDTQLLKIDPSTFDVMIQENPDIVVRMLRKLARSVREYQDAQIRASKIASRVLEPQPEEAPAGAAAGEAEAGPDDSTADADAVAQGAEAEVPALFHRISGKSFPLADGEVTTIGRIDRSTGIAPDVDFDRIDVKRTLSRSHARIVHRDDGYYVIEEKGVGNGTFVNDERIDSDAEVKIEDGDEVRFGLVETVFRGP